MMAFFDTDRCDRHKTEKYSSHFKWRHRPPDNNRHEQ